MWKLPRTKPAGDTLPTPQSLMVPDVAGGRRLALGNPNREQRTWSKHSDQNDLNRIADDVSDPDAKRVNTRR